MADEIEARAREWIRVNQPEPLKCVHCGSPQPSVVACSASSWPCPKSAGGHVFEGTFSTDYEGTEAARIAAFHRAMLRELEKSGHLVHGPNCKSKYPKHGRDDDGFWRVVERFKCNCGYPLAEGSDRRD